MDMVRQADWIVDVGPAAGENGGRVLYSGPIAGLAEVEESVTRPFLLEETTSDKSPAAGVTRRVADAWLELHGMSKNNLHHEDVSIPLGTLTAITGVSGAGKSTLLELIHAASDTRDIADASPGFAAVDRVVQVDQRPIGRTLRSNLATYTALFDAVRRTFAAADDAKARGFGPGRFSFNVAGGRCETCLGEGFVAVELLFLPGSYGPCPECGGARFNAETLEVQYNGRNIAQVLELSVAAAAQALSEIPAVLRSLNTLRDVGLGYLRLGQPAPELSGGEAQRIKMATELQRLGRGHTLYLLDEPTTGLHPADVQLLLH